MTTGSRYRLANPLAPYQALRRHWPLVMQMGRRDVTGRYRGSFMGLLWSFFNPLLMLAVYTFVFAVIFKSRWNAQSSGPLEFAVILFAGLNIHSLFAECANRAPALIVENTNFVKKVVFPLETMAWSTVGAALFHLAVSTGVLVLVSFLVRGSVPWTIILFPLVVVAFIPFLAGTVWLLASLGAFLRDLKQVIGVMTTALMFLAPIFYPKELIPEAFRGLLYLNPLTAIAEASRDVIVWGRIPDWRVLGFYALCSSMFAWASFAWFERSRKAFSDVL